MNSILLSHCHVSDPGTRTDIAARPTHREEPRAPPARASLALPPPRPIVVVDSRSAGGGTGRYPDLVGSADYVAGLPRRCSGRHSDYKPASMRAPLAVMVGGACCLLSVGGAGNDEEPGLSVPLALFGAEDLSSALPATRRPVDDQRFFGTYYAVIAIGGQRFNVQLDTGSSNLVVPAADCDGCVAGMRRYRQNNSPSGELVRCGSERCSGYCNPTVCKSANGATCNMRDSPPQWALDLQTNGSNTDHSRSSCADDIHWRGPDGRGCEKFRESAEWCGEGESVARCPESCRSCGRCCTAAGGCFFEQTYADLTGGTGALYSDDLSLVGLDRSNNRMTAKARVVFGAASLITHSSSALFAPLGVDGVLGIGYSWLNCHPTCVPAPLDALLGTIASSIPLGSAGTSDAQNTFALCLTTPTVAAECINLSKACGSEEVVGPDRATNSRTYEGAGGTWDIGWVDRMKYVGELQYLAILHESYYIVRAPVGARLAPSGSETTSRPNNKGIGASGLIRKLSPKMWGLTVFDSGTTLTVIPPAVFEIIKPALLSQLQAQASTATGARVLSRIFDDMCVPAPSGGYNKSTIAESFPRLELVFRGVSIETGGVSTGARGRPFTLSWGPEHYLYWSPYNLFDNKSRSEPGSEKQRWLCSGIVAFGDRTVLGASFLRAFYTVFDRANKRIGVAPSAPKCSSVRGCIETCSTTAPAGLSSTGTAESPSQHQWVHFLPCVICAVSTWACRRRCRRIVLSACGRYCCG